MRQFCADYATYSYTRARPATWPDAQPDHAGAGGHPGAAFATPGVAQTRTQQKQVATGSGAITALRAFGAVEHDLRRDAHPEDHSTAGGRASQTPRQLRDHGRRSGSSWQVNDIELASAGNS